MFREAATYNNHTDLHEYTETVTTYIKKCIDDVTVTKTIKQAKSCGIKQAKRLYAQKINNHFTDSKDTRSLWQAIQTITDYKPLPQACDDDTSLPDALNEFYARFEMQNDTPAQKLPTPPNNQALCLSPADVRKTLSRVNPRNAACPDNIPGRVLRDWAAQLTDVLTDIFNTSLSQAVIPTFLKSTSIIPVPKKSPVSCLNDCRPIALTPIMMKCFERRPQSVRVGHNTSSTTTLSTGAPQGCVLSPLLFTLLTHNCTAKFSSNHIIKFADDTVVLAEWCGANNLSLIVSKTKEVVMDFRRNSADHALLTIDSSAVERDLTWTTNTMSLSKKAQQRLHFLRRLKSASLPPPILTTFYRGTIESVLTSCITVWYGNCSAADRKNLQRTVNTAAKIIRTPLPSLLDNFLTQCSSKATSIVKDPTHPSHHLFQLLPSGRCYRSIRAHSARLLNSFFPQAVSGLDKPPVVTHFSSLYAPDTFLLTLHVTRT
ncbi:hypothetical protein M9458_051026 [Cirrhinus mrigala]|uniref:Reverse transcriptase domain-containing protein n=1 Tax=Cirrhinus mrigala TaxID=683832 RepID=A0ABD0MYK6_CIRMR